MQEMKDTAIKLFGRTIPLLLSDRAAESAAISGEDSAGVSHTCGGGGGGDIEDMMKSSDYDRPSMIVCSEEEDEKKKANEILEKADNKDLLKGEFSEVQRHDTASQPIKGDSTTQETFKETNENPRTPSIDVETATINISKTEKEQNDTTDSQEKTLQKPDKIIPCPRCNSMDTKFCYYNNYNVHQPRYFCKSCQRYWTAGGTMRNVPVGAGRRKNKNAAAVSHYSHITISEAVHAARIDAPNGVHHPALKCNGTVLRFGSDASLSDSVASALNLNEKTLWNGTRNGFHKMEEQRIQDPSSVRENGDNHSCGSSVTATNSTEEGSRNCAQQTFLPNFNGFAPQIQCLPGVPWPYPWNSAVPPPSFCPPGMPVSFYPAGYWNCTIPGTWNVPWIASPNQNAQSPGPNSQTLGKHSRDADMLEPEKEKPQRQKNSESGIWIPKTLRIDDPEEAAKSSIWTTLGIKNEFISKGGLFKAFQPKTFEKNHVAESSPALRANPAALSRSINFHERS